MLSESEYVGGIPVILHLADQDVITAQRPPPIAFILPRTTLLIAILRDALEAFSPFAAALHQYQTQVWFAYNGHVLRWTYPVGAVKDYVADLQRLTGHHGSEAEPLEMDFRICQPSSSKTLQRDAPFFVNFKRLDDYIRNEIKQVHKASYTVLYGAYKYYQNKSEATLRPALGMALYRPFEVEQDSSASGGSTHSPHAIAAAPTTQLLSAAHDSPHAGSEEAVVLRPGASPITSPYLLLEYQRLLADSFADPPVARMVQLGYPASCNAAVASPWFHAARVSSAPSVTEDSEMTLGILLWRLLRVPCLRHAARTGCAVAETPTGSYDALWALFAPWFAEAPESAQQSVDQHEPLQTAVPGLVPWAAWEAAMVKQFICDYEPRGASPRGLFVGPNKEQRVVFTLQGTQPSLATPVKFLERYLMPSDRCVYVVVQVFRNA